MFIKTRFLYIILDIACIDVFADNDIVSTDVYIFTRLLNFTSVKPAKPNQQNQTKPIKLFSTYFVLIFTTNNNFVPCAILEKTVTLPA